MRIKRSIEGWLLNAQAQRVLLLQVPARPGDHDAFWQPVTGGIKGNETPLQACLREVAEETGLRLDSGNVKVVVDGFDVVINQSLTVRKVVYAVQVSETSGTTLNPDEHQDARWVPVSEVEGWLLWESNRETWKHIAQSLAQA